MGKFKVGICDYSFPKEASGVIFPVLFMWCMPIRSFAISVFASFLPHTLGSCWCLWSEILILYVAIYTLVTLCLDIHVWLYILCAGIPVGHWMLPCVQCAKPSTCFWREAVWAPNTCKHSRKNHHQSKNCTINKKVNVWII